MSVQEQLKQIIDENDVILFMKGTPDFPQCGFSGRSTQILNAVGAKFATVDVLSDDEIRAGIKQFSNWPTVPQLYIKGEFIGGSDIMVELYENGELKQKVDALSA